MLTNTQTTRNTPITTQTLGTYQDLYIGIDVSKNTLDVHIRPLGEVLYLVNKASGLVDLKDHLKLLESNGFCIKVIALEATGGYERLSFEALGMAGFSVAIVNPAQVCNFAKALGRRAKTDVIDTAVIAHFAEATTPEIRPQDEGTKHISI